MIEVIDELIRKYGADALIDEIKNRKYTYLFDIPRKRGAPAVSLSNLLGLREVMSDYRRLYPHEPDEALIKKMLKRMRDYRKFEKYPDVYEKELAAFREEFEKISWLGNYGKKDLSPKTILNKLAKLEADIRKRPQRISTINYSEDIGDNETFEDLPFDTESYLEQEVSDLMSINDDQKDWL